MNLAERVHALRAEANHLYKRLQRHYEVCGCWERLFEEHRLNYDADCFVGISLRHAWVGLKEASELPSPDPRMYRDVPGDKATTATAGATT